MEVEITEIPVLQKEEQSLLNMHGLLNVLNVLRGELTLMGLTLAGDMERLRDSLKICDRVTASLKDPALALEFASHVAEHETRIRADVEEAIARHPAKAASPDLAESKTNLDGVFQVLPPPRA